jgi:hypothetical protein
MNPGKKRKTSMHFTWRALGTGGFVTGGEHSAKDLGKMEASRWTTMYLQLLDLKVIQRPFDPATTYTLQSPDAR